MLKIMVVDVGGGVYEEVRKFYASKQGHDVEVYRDSKKALTTLRSSPGAYRQVVIAWDSKRPNDSFNLKRAVEEVSNCSDIPIVYCQGPERELRLVEREPLN